MAFTVLGLIDGISGSLVVIIGVLMGVFFHYQGKKKNAKLLKQLGGIAVCAGLLYLGVLVDFLSLITTGYNFPNEFRQVALLSYFWFPPLVILAIYLAGQIQFPGKEKYFVIPYLILGAIFYILIFLDPVASFYSDFYEDTTPRMIDYNINLSSIAGIFLLMMLIPVIISLGFGLIYHSTKTTGVLKKKFLILAAGAFCYGIFGSMEGFTVPGVLVIIVRIGFLGSFWLMYFGIKPPKDLK